MSCMKPHNSCTYLVDYMFGYKAAVVVGIPQRYWKRYKLRLMNCDWVTGLGTWTQWENKILLETDYYLKVWTSKYLRWEIRMHMHENIPGSLPISQHRIFKVLKASDHQIDQCRRQWRHINKWRRQRNVNRCKNTHVEIGSSHNRLEIHKVTFSVVFTIHFRKVIVEDLWWKLKYIYVKQFFILIFHLLISLNRV